ncbi:MAG: ORF6N domain-containing protein [Burkholderiales bacterium]
MAQKAIIPLQAVANRIFVLRGQRVMLDSDLAELYDVESRVLLQAVKRNAGRFPLEFTFELTAEEWQSLRSQFVILKTGRGQHRKYLPYAFTEHGALQLASVLRSERAVEMSILIVRAFVRLRELLATDKDLATKFEKLERRLDMSDAAIAELYEMVRQLMTPPDTPKRRIGF